MNAIINKINNNEIYTITLEDLYIAYEKNKLISLIKIVNGKLNITIDQED